MSVELDPAELGFKRKRHYSILSNKHSRLTSVSGPFNHEVSEVLRLKNPNSEPLAFKVSGMIHDRVMLFLIYNARSKQRRLSSKSQ